MSTASLQSGSIVTVAGTGEPAYSGDGGPATAACLNEPKGIALDPEGNLYIVDAENHLIRKVEAKTEKIVTVAGMPRAETESCSRSTASPAVESDPQEEDPLSEPVAHQSGRYLQVADLSGTVRFVTSGVSRGQSQIHGDGGAATQATLNVPSAVAIAADGTLYLADTFNHRIRRVDPITGLIRTIAGTGHPRYSGDGGQGHDAALNEPNAVALDEGRGFLFIADQSNNRVRRVVLSTGVISTVAGTGEAAYNGDGQPATDASLAGPSGIAVGPDGTLYIADTFNGRIRAVDPTNGVIRTVAGDGSQYSYQGMSNDRSASVSRPHAIALDAEGNLFLTDSDNHLIRRWDGRTQMIARVAGIGAAQYGGDGGAAQEASLNYPFGVAVDRQGNVYIADTFNHRIRMVVA